MNKNMEKNGLWRLDWWKKQGVEFTDDRFYLRMFLIYLQIIRFSKSIFKTSLAIKTGTTFSFLVSTLVEILITRHGGYLSIMQISFQI